MLTWFRKANYRQLSLHALNDENDRRNRSPRFQHSNYRIALLACVGLLILSMGVGLESLRRAYFTKSFSSTSLPSPPGNINQIWYYDQTFSRPPSRETEEAWASIFPRGRGFFSHPHMDANISLIAVFHELHCLNSIRLAYYAALGESYVLEYNLDTEDSKTDALNSHTDPHHVRHCFDYLRRALMCAADTNLEIYDWSLGGSTGWGEERICQDYDRVSAWAENWRPRREMFSGNRTLIHAL